MSKIVIVGNGLDLYTGLRSKFADFYEYGNYIPFLKSDKTKYKEWSDLEYAIFQTVDHGIWVDLPDFINNLSKFNTNLCTYLRSEENRVKNFHYDSHIQEELNSADLIINFNYTDTLETIYNVDPRKDFHIHGSIDEMLDADISIIIGAASYKNQEFYYASDKFLKFDKIYCRFILGFERYVHRNANNTEIEQLRKYYEAFMDVRSLPTIPIFQNAMSGHPDVKLRKDYQAQLNNKVKQITSVSDLIRDDLKELYNIYKYIGIFNQLFITPDFSSDINNLDCKKKIRKIKKMLLQVGYSRTLIKYLKEIGFLPFLIKNFNGNVIPSLKKITEISIIGHSLSPTRDCFIDDDDILKAFLSDISLSNINYFYYSKDEINDAESYINKYSSIKTNCIAYQNSNKNSL